MSGTERVTDQAETAHRRSSAPTDGDKAALHELLARAPFSADAAIGLHPTLGNHRVGQLVRSADAGSRIGTAQRLTETPRAPTSSSSQMISDALPAGAADLAGTSSGPLDASTGKIGAFEDIDSQASGMAADPGQAVPMGGATGSEIGAKDDAAAKASSDLGVKGDTAAGGAKDSGGVSGAVGAKGDEVGAKDSGAKDSGAAGAKGAESTVGARDSGTAGAKGDEVGAKDSGAKDSGAKDSGAKDNGAAGAKGVESTVGAKGGGFDGGGAKDSGSEGPGAKGAEAGSAGSKGAEQKENPSGSGPGSKAEAISPDSAVPKLSPTSKLPPAPKGIAGSKAGPDPKGISAVKGAPAPKGEPGGAGSAPGLATESTESLTSVNVELAEHQRWAAGSSAVGAANSDQRAAFLADAAGSGLNEGLVQGFGMGFVMGLGIGLLEHCVPIPGLGLIIGGAMALHGIIENWDKTTDSISQMGEGADIYERLANDLAGIATIIDLIANILNVIGGIAGVIALVMWIITMATLGAASPLAALITLIASLALLGVGVVNMLAQAVIQPCVAMFRAMHAFQSEADPRSVEAQGAKISTATGIMGGQIGGMAGALAGGAAAKGIAGETPPRVQPEPPPGARAEPPAVTFEAPAGAPAEGAGPSTLPGGFEAPLEGAPTVRDPAGPGVSPLAESVRPGEAPAPTTTPGGFEAPLEGAPSVRDPAAPVPPGELPGPQSPASAPAEAVGPKAPADAVGPKAPADAVGPKAPNEAGGPAPADDRMFTDADLAAWEQLEAPKQDTTMAQLPAQDPLNPKVGLLDVREPYVDKGGTFHSNIDLGGVKTVTVSDAPAPGTAPAGGKTGPIPQTTVGGEPPAGNVEFRYHGPRKGAPAGSLSNKAPTIQVNSPGPKFGFMGEPAVGGEVNRYLLPDGTFVEFGKMTPAQKADAHWPAGAEGHPWPPAAPKGGGGPAGGGGKGGGGGGKGGGGGGGPAPAGGAGPGPMGALGGPKGAGPKALAAPVAIDAAAKKGVEIVNPNYKNPPGTPQQIDAVRTEILLLLGERARTQAAGAKAAGLQAQHEGFKFDVAKVNQTLDKATAGTAAHKEAVAAKTTATTQQQQQQSQSQDTIKSYPDRISGILVLRAPLDGFRSFTHYASMLPGEIGAKFHAMNADANRFNGALDRLNAQMAQQIAGGPAQAAGLEQQGARLTATNDKAAVAQEQFAKQRSEGDRLNAANDEKIQLNADLKKRADAQSAKADGEIEQKQTSADQLAKQLTVWAAEHRMARTKALEDTAARYSARGMRVATSGA